MKIERFDISDRYVIKCKEFLPDDGVVTRVILGVHGFAGDKESSMLTALAKAFQSDSTSLVCFDFPSHGQSPVNEECLTVENCKKDLIAVAELIRNKYPNAKKFLFATSFGGYISLISKEMLEDFSMILRSPAVTMPRVLLDNVLGITAFEFEKAGRVECGFERKIDLPYSFYKELLIYDPFELDYRDDFLIIHGDLDDIVPLSHVLSFSGLHGSARLVIINGADHRFKHNGETDRVIFEVKKFISDRSKCGGEVT